MTELQLLYEKRLELAKQIKELGQDPTSLQLQAIQELCLAVTETAAAQGEHLSRLQEALSRVTELLEVQKLQAKDLQQQAVASLRLDQPLKIESPTWYKPFDAKAVSDALFATFQAFFTKLAKLQENVKIKNREKGEAIPVKFVSADGNKFYDLQDVRGGGGGVIGIDQVSINHGGSPTQIDPIAVDENGTAALTISVDSYKELQLVNSGSNLVAFGQSGLVYANSPKIIPNQWFPFPRPRKNFTLYFRTDTGKTSTILGYLR